MVATGDDGDKIRPDLGGQSIFRTQRLEQIREIVGENSTGHSDDMEGAKGILHFIVDWETKPKDEEYFKVLNDVVGDSRPMPTIDDITNAVLATEFLYEDELNPDNNYRPEDIDEGGWDGWSDAVDTIKFNIGQTVVDSADMGGINGLVSFYDVDNHRQMFVRLADNRILNVDERIEYDTFPRELRIVTEGEMEKALGSKIDDDEGKRRRKVAVDEYMRSEFEGME